MKIVLLQINIIWNSPDENRLHIESIINNSPDADIIILPEMFTTGYCTSPREITEKTDTVTLSWMQRIAEEKNVALAGSVITEEKGNFFNRFYFVKPDKSYTTYNKRHLFSYAGEDKEYSKGEDRKIVNYKGVRILLQICYDVRFPVFSRNRSDYDMIIYVANWPVPRIDAWNTLIRARAIENVSFVAAVNRIGNDLQTHYNGGTVLLNYIGKEISAAEFGKEDTVFGEIDMEALAKFREKFPVLNDADNFSLEI